MGESYREQRPLLCDDYSDEDFDANNYQRRNRHSVRSGRARNYAKGAAVVITRWPDNCSTSITYWWLGVSMIAITIFVIYNSVIIFGMIPTSNMKQPKYRIFNNEIKSKVQTSLPDVYMHLITKNSTDALLNKYIPYVTVISKKYPRFQYKFLVILNDTINDIHDYKDEERNHIAFNSLWSNENFNKKITSKYNISVEYITLSVYLNDSPINKFWRHLPPHLIEFLVRSISIWEKGGIAFNPKILLPKRYNSGYIEKLYDVFNMFYNLSTESAKQNSKFKVNVDASTRRPNNIQDIINGLTNNADNISNIDLSEAENNNVAVVSNMKSILKVKRDLKYNNEVNNNVSNNMKKNDKLHVRETFNSTNSSAVIENILPLFLKYLFENKSKDTTNEINLEMSSSNRSLFDNSIRFRQNQSIPVQKNSTPSQDNEKNKNSTVYNKSSIENTNEILPILKYDDVPTLYVDIKGNVIASKTACHAFLGTMFSNVIQHTEEESLTDFIISELSLFCKGLLQSCAGVNVILG